jgi:hypothetical protein
LLKRKTALQSSRSYTLYSSRVYDLKGSMQILGRSYPERAKVAETLLTTSKKTVIMRNDEKERKFSLEGSLEESTSS